VAEGLSQQYQGRLVVQDFSFQFQPGRIYGIIGANGAGKSTLLRLLSAMEKPSAGRVLLNGKVLTGPVPEISCVWQRPYLFQQSVQRNIRYGLRLRRWPRAAERERLQQLLTVFRLEDMKDQWAPKLSGGETARVAIARAVAPHPKILLLDEPTANLDPSNTRLVERALYEVHEEEGTTIILVTHDMFQAKRLADITLYLSGGRLIEYGPSRTIFQSPVSEETRRFINGEL